ncbi:unnamed protein product [Polarella glacialis]|uniref:Uncharacterized protein n=1 Tax=Polarella glacialis TaxID=89957 RepID=A0A813E2B1_POLGL|nr:unnamed protein product [Polarella glacialis]CAE8617231.1 unnamed protein product [Polarella glacialis]
MGQGKLCPKFAHMLPARAHLGSEARAQDFSTCPHSILKSPPDPLRYITCLLSFFQKRRVRPAPATCGSASPRSAMPHDSVATAQPRALALQRKVGRRAISVEESPMGS